MKFKFNVNVINYVTGSTKYHIYEIAEKWTMPLRNWGKVLSKLDIMYPDRIG